MQTHSRVKSSDDSFVSGCHLPEAPPAVSPTATITSTATASPLAAVTTPASSSSVAPHVTVVKDTEGNLLHIGRKARKVSTPLWRALFSRDRTCQFPGCSRTRHLQAHHIEHWAKGGETNPDNLLLLCRTHHWAVHEGGFRVGGRVPQGLVFRRADGSVLPVSPVHPPIKEKAGETLKEANLSGQDHNTVDSFWDGEAMDLHMAVDALLTYDDDSVDEE